MVAQEDNFPSFRNAKVHYHVHKILPLFPILSQTNLVTLWQLISLQLILIFSSHLCPVLPTCFNSVSYLNKIVSCRFVICTKNSTCFACIILFGLEIIVFSGPRKEDCLNTSTLALRDVAGDEKRTRCLGATRSLGDINTETWSSRLGIGQTCAAKKYCCKIQRSENQMQSGRIF
jgi:hypothetical protein